MNCILSALSTQASQPSNVQIYSYSGTVIGPLWKNSSKTSAD